MSEKTEQPTPKKLQDAKKKGQVAKSKEIVTCAVIVGLFGYVWGFFDAYLERLKHLIVIPAQYYQLPFGQALVRCAKTGFQEFILLSLPIIAAASTIVVLSNLMQIGFMVSFEPITPDIKKINPMEGIKKIFSLSNLVELLKSIAKIVLLGGIMYIVITGRVQDLLNMIHSTKEEIPVMLGATLKRMVLWVSALFIVVAILDHFLQKYLHIKKLKMSKDEVKREHKDREGDPHLKGRRRQLQMEMASDDMAMKIRESTIVLTQSKQLAVAVYYERGKTLLPIITVKGKSRIAEKVVEMAKKHNIPVYEDAALTRDLYKKVEQDNYISSEFIQPVAEKLRKAMGLEG